MGRPPRVLPTVPRALLLLGLGWAGVSCAGRATRPRPRPDDGLGRAAAVATPSDDGPGRGDDTAHRGPGPGAGGDGGSSPSDPAEARGARLAEGLELSELLRLAWSRNPAVREARERAGAAAQGPAQAWRLPDPTLRLGWYAEPVQTRTGTQEWTLALSQGLPWPGRLNAREDQARARAEGARLASEDVQWRVAAELVRTYHELLYLHGAIEVSRAVEEEARRLVAVAADGRAERRTSTPELVRAETFLAQLEYDRLSLTELREVERARLRSLLALPPDQPLGDPRPLDLPRLGLALPSLQEAAVARSPRVARRRAELAAAESGLAASETLRRPDLSLMARTIGTDGYAGSSDPDNGNDPFVLELGVSLPVWEGSNGAAIRESRHGVRAARAALDGEAEGLRTEVARAWWRVTNAERLVDLHRDVLLPQAERAARAAEGLFEAGDSSFAGLLETVVAWQHFELAALRARADQGQALAELEGLLGAPLEAVPRPAVSRPDADADGAPAPATEDAR